jgi:hypothetical protein
MTTRAEPLIGHVRNALGNSARNNRTIDRRFRVVSFEIGGQRQKHKIRSEDLPIHLPIQLPTADDGILRYHTSPAIQDRSISKFDTRSGTMLKDM